MKNSLFLYMYLIVLGLTSFFLVSYTDAKTGSTFISFVSPDSKYQITHAQLYYHSHNTNCPSLDYAQIIFRDKSTVNISLKRECFPYDFILEYYCKDQLQTPCYVGNKEGVEEGQDPYLTLSIPVKKQTDAPETVPSYIKRSSSISISVVGDFENRPLKNIKFEDRIYYSCRQCESTNIRGIDLLACDCYDVISLYQNILDCLDLSIPDSFVENCKSLNREIPNANITFSYHNYQKSNGMISKDQEITVWDCRGNVTKKYCHLR